MSKPHAGIFLIRYEIHEKQIDGHVNPVVLHSESCVFNVGAKSKEEAKKVSDEIYNKIKEVLTQYE